eukprot:s293_g1.t1
MCLRLPFLHVLTLEVANIRGPELDPCIYDVSECSGVSQGGSCRIRCKVPYLGASREAVCPFSGNSGVEENLTFKLPTCVAALEQDQVSCPNPPEIPMAYQQLQETGDWVCAPGFHGTALRECTVIRMGEACLLQAAFSGCAALTGCLAPDPATDYPEGLASDVPACGYDTTGCENVQNGQIYSPPACDKICPNPVVEEAGPGYSYDIFTNQWSCTPEYTGRAVKQCDINQQCQRHVEMIGCLPRMPCAVPELDPCRYDWSSCGDLSAGVNCAITCRSPYEGRNSWWAAALHTYSLVSSNVAASGVSLE